MHRGRRRKWIIRLIAGVMIIAVLAGVIYGIYKVLDNAAGEEYYINMDDISKVPITE